MKNGKLNAEMLSKTLHFVINPQIWPQIKCIVKNGQFEKQKRLGSFLIVKKVD